MAILKVMNTAGKFTDANALDDVISYILNERKTKGYYDSWAINDIQRAAEEMNTLARLAGKDNNVRLRHFMISFTEKSEITSSPVFALMVSSEIAEYYADEYQIVFAVHTNRKHIHTHFVMNSVNYKTGEKYRGKKADMYAFLKHCTSVLRKYDIYERVVLKNIKDENK